MQLTEISSNVVSPKSTLPIESKIKILPFLGSPLLISVLANRYVAGCDQRAAARCYLVARFRPKHCCFYWLFVYRVFSSAVCIHIFSSAVCIRSIFIGCLYMEYFIGCWYTEYCHWLSVYAVAVRISYFSVHKPFHRTHTVSGPS